MSDIVLQERRGSVAILTMNDPARMNLFSPAMRDALIQRIGACGEDEACRAIVLAAAGPHFSAGGDIRSFTESSAVDIRARMERGSGPLARLIAAGRKPIVTAIEGNCFGAGLSMAAASDFVVAARDARFCAAFVRLGFLPDIGLLWSLPRRVGLGKAKLMTALATVVGAEEAERIGLVDATVEPGGALAEALSVAERFAAMPPLTLSFLKAAFAEGLEDVLRTELAIQPVLASTEDHAEGKAAFLEKRSPQFKGR